MQGIRIRDLHPGGYLEFDLVDLLRVVGPAADSSIWRCHNVWSTAKDTSQGNPLEAFANTGAWVSGSELAAAAERTQQVIDGEFVAYRSRDDGPWLRLVADDSPYWEVFSLDKGMVEKLRNAFTVMAELDENAA